MSIKVDKLAVGDMLHLNFEVAGDEEPRWILGRVTEIRDVVFELCVINSVPISDQWMSEMRFGYDNLGETSANLSDSVRSLELV